MKAQNFLGLDCCSPASRSVLPQFYADPPPPPRVGVSVYRCTAAILRRSRRCIAAILRRSPPPRVGVSVYRCTAAILRRSPPPPPGRCIRVLPLVYADRPPPPPHPGSVYRCIGVLPQLYADRPPKKLLKGGFWGLVVVCCRVCFICCFSSLYPTCSLPLSPSSFLIFLLWGLFHSLGLCFVFLKACLIRFLASLRQSWPLLRFSLTPQDPILSFKYLSLLSRFHFSPLLLPQHFLTCPLASFCLGLSLSLAGL